MPNTVADSPDASARGLLSADAAPLRYDQAFVVAKEDRHEVPGILRSWMPEGVRVLDVGCAAGALTLRTTHGKHNEVVGIEPDPIRADLARARGLKVECGLLDQQFVESHGQFDVVMFSDVLEHVAAPSQLLALASRVLAKDGVVIASMPNVAHWTARLMLLTGRFEYSADGIMDATHLRWFTLKSARQLFEAQGFKVIEMSTSAGTWMPVYRKLPFSLAPGRLRRFVVRSLSRLVPTLFGCQILVRATRAETQGSSTFH